MSSVAETPPLPAFEAPDPPLWPLTLEMVEAMVRAGILSEKEPVYLWKGRLARRMAPKRPHSVAVARVAKALETVLWTGWHVEQEQPLAFRLSHSAPQPDVMILRGRLEDYPIELPSTADAALVVEVADSSLPSDRRMAAEYAAEGIPTYWIVDVAGGRLEVHSQPEGGTYRSAAVHEKADRIPLVIEGQNQGEILVSDLLP